MLTRTVLDLFTGTEAYHRWSALFPYTVLTDGAQYVAEEGKAYWLMDLIASHQHGSLRFEEFQVWELIVQDSAGVVIAEDGNGHELARQQIPYTDFPFGIKLYAIYDADLLVILLPGEY